MEKEELRLLFDKELRQNLHSPGYRREETEHVVRHVSMHGERGFVIHSNLNEENADEIIQEELSYFNRLGVGFEWKVYSYDKPAHLKDILEQRGFTIEPRESLMVMEITDMHPFPQQEETDVQEIVDEKGIREIIALLDNIWEESHNELGDRLWRDKQNDPDSLYLYGVYDKDQLVSAAWVYLEKNSSFASLWGGSTLPDYRGKGFYTSLLAIRAAKAIEKGYQFLTVDASQMSRPILEKHGFRCLAYTYGCQSPEHPTS
ncbi:GNAT family N-acetyltransferase [Sporosarcina sp. ACRSL]|uniref:GNAT family N-acetyltransferase n=1 Tax=Sporosarcina sp. ACRSL TaxID=2918215 RepID=UPI001EF558F1|nr:GNAT family N-acetyltransferase [Sporosarcina sp. ACRSL]MCG7345399.1 GNAT family N-acetyltransferase [Sporosarcina sp. ACRSL]